MIAYKEFYHCKRVPNDDGSIIEYKPPVKKWGNYQPLDGYVDTLKYGESVNQRWRLQVALKGNEKEYAVGDLMYLDGDKPDTTVKGYEYGEHEGLGLLKGQVVGMAGKLPSELKIPHMGWNALQFTRESKLFSKIADGDFVYFVHSYYACECDDAVIATAEYSAPLTAAVAKDNVFGCQFHPEKSGSVGLEILRAFSEM